MTKRLLILSFFLLIANIFIAFSLKNETKILNKNLFSSFPLKFEGWKGKVLYFDDKIIKALNVSEYMLRKYSNGDKAVTIYIGYYASQKEGAQIHSPKHCLPGSGWFKLSERIKSLKINGFGKVNYVEAVYKKDEYREMFAYWYQMKDVNITNEYLLKLYMVINSFRYGSNEAAFIRISSPILGNKEETSQILQNFIETFYPLIYNTLNGQEHKTL